MTQYIASLTSIVKIRTKLYRQPLFKIIKHDPKFQKIWQTFQYQIIHYPLYDYELTAIIELPKLNQLIDQNFDMHTYPKINQFLKREFKNSPYQSPDE